jgi:hypothetical protein
MPAVFSVFDSPSASDLFDPSPRKKPYKPLTWKAASKSCANCEAYAFELQNTIHRLLTANSEKYRVVLLSLDDTNARLENRFFKMENLTHKKASELAQELDVDALLVPTVGLSYRLEPNVEIPFMLPLSSGTTLGAIGLGVANERWFPRSLEIKLFNGPEPGLLWGIGQERDYDIPYFQVCNQKNILIELPEVFPYRTSASRSTLDEYYPGLR